MSCSGCIDKGSCDGSCDYGPDDEWCIGCSAPEDACRCDSEQGDEGACFRAWLDDLDILIARERPLTGSPGGYRKARRKLGYSARPSVRRRDRDRWRGLAIGDKVRITNRVFDAGDMVQARGEELRDGEADPDECPF